MEIDGDTNRKRKFDTPLREPISKHATLQSPLSRSVHATSRRRFPGTAEADTSSRKDSSYMGTPPHRSDKSRDSSERAPKLIDDYFQPVFPSFGVSSLYKQNRKAEIQNSVEDNRCPRCVKIELLSRCSFCLVKYCSNCRITCSKCQEEYCLACSTSVYSDEIDGSLCLDCLQTTNTS
jgi:hypothetical protein